MSYTEEEIKNFIENIAKKYPELLKEAPNACIIPVLEILKTKIDLETENLANWKENRKGRIRPQWSIGKDSNRSLSLFGNFTLCMP